MRFYGNAQKMIECIEAMLLFRLLHLCCCGMLCVILTIIVCLTLISNNCNWREMVQIEEKIPRIANFIKSKSRAFDKRRDGEDAECSICLQLYVDDPPGILIAELNCSNKHIFHKDCLIKWIENNNICPLCREIIPSK